MIMLVDLGTELQVAVGHFRGCNHAAATSNLLSTHHCLHSVDSAILMICTVLYLGLELVILIPFTFLTLSDAQALNVEFLSRTDSS